MGDLEIPMLVDTGASVSAIAEEIAELIKQESPHKIKEMKKPEMSIAVATTEPVEIKEAYRIQFEIENKTYYEEFMVLPKMNCTILGMPFFRKNKVLIDPVGNQLHFAEENATIQMNTMKIEEEKEIKQDPKKRVKQMMKSVNEEVLEKNKQNIILVQLEENEEEMRREMGMVDEYPVFEKKTGCIVMSSLSRIDDKGRIPIGIINISPHTVTIPKGTKIAYFKRLLETKSDFLQPLDPTRLRIAGEIQAGDYRINQEEFNALTTREATFWFPTPESCENPEELTGIRKAIYTKLKEFKELEKLNPKKSTEQKQKFLTNFANGFKESILSKEGQEKLKEILVKHHEVFARHRLDIGRNDEYRVTLTPEHSEPVYSQSRPTPINLREELLIELALMQYYDIVTTLDSSKYASPIFAHRKPNGKLRILIDLRKINHLIRHDYDANNFPIATMEDVNAHLAGKRYFSKLDCSQAYFTLPMADDQSIQLLAFNFGSRTYAFKRLAQGLSRSVSAFSAFVRRVLEECIEADECFAFVDDVGAGSATEEEHLKTVDRILYHLKKAGLRLTMHKCEFGVAKIEFLGKTITSLGQAPIRTHVEKFLEKLQMPKNQKQFQRFIGFVNFFRQFIPHLATKLLPFYKLTRETKIEITDRHKEIFETLKEDLRVACDTNLRLAKPDAQYVLITDASDFATGFVLMIEDYTIEQEKKKMKQYAPVAFGSRVFTPTQYKLSPYCKEFLAIHFGFDTFAHYLWGLEKPVLVLTDNSAITCFFQSKGTPRPLWNAVDHILNFRFILGHIPGKANAAADYISRLELNPGEHINLQLSDEIEVRKIKVDMSMLIRDQGLQDKAHNIQENEKPELANTEIIRQNDEIWQEINEKKEQTDETNQEEKENEENEKQYTIEVYKGDIRKETNIMYTTCIVGKDRTTMYRMLSEWRKRGHEEEDEEPALGEIRTIRVNPQNKGENERRIYEMYTRMEPGKMPNLQTIFRGIRNLYKKLEKLGVKEIAFETPDIEMLPEKRAYINEAMEFWAEETKILSKRYIDPWKVEKQQREMKQRNKQKEIKINKVLKIERTINKPKETEFGIEEKVIQEINALKMANPLMIRDITETEPLHIIAEQKRDPVLREVVSWLRNGIRPPQEYEKTQLKPYRKNFKRIIQHRGILCRKFYTEDAQRYLLQICIPESRQEEMIRQLHVNKYEGHKGVKATIQQARTKMYFPSMCQKIQVFISNCISCLQVKPVPSRALLTPLQEIISLQNFPGEMLQMDLVGPMESKGRYRHILTAIDGFSKYLFTRALKDVKASTIARKMVGIFTEHSYIPQQIQTDKGTQFNSELMKELCDIMDIQLNIATVAHPQTIGLLERTHSGLKKTIKILTGAGKDWPSNLSTATYAYNTTYHSSTGMTPSTIFHGRIPYKPLDIRIGTEKLQEYCPIKSTTEDWQNRMNKVYEANKEAIIAAFVKYKNYYDRKAGAAPLRLHSYCLILNPHLADQRMEMNKMDSLWWPLHRIEALLDNNNYLVREVNTKYTRILHRIRIRPVIPQYAVEDIEVSPNEFRTNPTEKENQELETYDEEWAKLSTQREEYVKGHLQEKTVSEDEQENEEHLDLGEESTATSTDSNERTEEQRMLLPKYRNLEENGKENALTDKETTEQESENNEETQMELAESTAHETEMQSEESETVIDEIEPIENQASWNEAMPTRPETRNRTRMRGQGKVILKRILEESEEENAEIIPVEIPGFRPDGEKSMQEADIVGRTFSDDDESDERQENGEEGQHYKLAKEMDEIMEQNWEKGEEADSENESIEIRRTKRKAKPNRKYYGKEFINQMQNERSTIEINWIGRKEMQNLKIGEKKKQNTQLGQAYPTKMGEDNRWKTSLIVYDETKEETTEELVSLALWNLAGKMDVRTEHTLIIPKPNAKWTNKQLQNCVDESWAHMKVTTLFKDN